MRARATAFVAGRLPSSTGTALTVGLVEHCIERLHRIDDAVSEDLIMAIGIRLRERRRARGLDEDVVKLLRRAIRGRAHEQASNARGHRACRRRAAEEARVVAGILAGRAADVGGERACRRHEIDAVAGVGERRLLVEIVDGADAKDAAHRLELVVADDAIIVAHREEDERAAAAAPVIEDVVDGGRERLRHGHGLREAPAVGDDGRVDVERELEGIDVGGDRDGAVREQAHATQATRGAAAGHALAVVGRGRDEPRAGGAVRRALLARVRARIHVAVDDVEARIELGNEVGVIGIAAGVDDDDGGLLVTERTPPRLGHLQVGEVPLPGITRIVRCVRVEGPSLQVEIGCRATHAGGSAVCVMEAIRDVDAVAAARVLHEPEARRGHERANGLHAERLEPRLGAGLERDDGRAIDERTHLARIALVAQPHGRERGRGGCRHGGCQRREALDRDAPISIEEPRCPRIASGRRILGSSGRDGTEREHEAGERSEAKGTAGRESEHEAAIVPCSRPHRSSGDHRPAPS
ncbi:Hypothetical protein A7982_03793 [Minicystis rosea]|nr:Hypothetical protein A7982_03793 [Minicystis rosea]